MRALNPLNGAATNSLKTSETFFIALTLFARVEGDSVNLFGTLTMEYSASEESTDTTYNGEHSTKFVVALSNVSPSGLITSIPVTTATNWGDSLAYSATVEDLGLETQYNSSFEMSSTSDSGTIVLVDFCFKYKTSLVISYAYSLNQSEGGTLEDEFESFSDSASETVTLTSYINGAQVQSTQLYSDSYTNIGTRAYSDPRYNGVNPGPDSNYHRVNLAVPMGDGAIARTVTLAIYGENFFTGPIGGMFWTVTFNRKTGAFSAIQEPDIRRVPGHPFASQIGLTHLKF